MLHEGIAEEFYIFKTTNFREITLNLVSFQANLNFYVNVVEAKDMWMKEYEKPTKYKFAFESLDIMGEDVVSITMDELRANKCLGTCFLYIGVMRHDETEMIAKDGYIIVATRGVRNLSEQVPVSMMLTGGTDQYFKFYKTCEECPLQFQLNLDHGHSLIISVTHEFGDELPHHMLNYHFKKHIH
jgi:hypothetical protein